MKPTLLVLAAGLGSRYGGVKQIDAVGLHDECLLDYATFDAQNSGFGNVVYIIRKDIEEAFRERLFDRIARNFDASYVFQSHEDLLTPEQISLSQNRKKPWGTLHAILCAEKSLNAPFAVINADDYYGRQGFETIGKHLAAMTAEGTEHAMVGYVLGNTMSRVGTVTRGICTVKDDYLDSIVETGGIGYEGEKIVCDDPFASGAKKELTGSEWASMNLFGFGTKAFETFHVYWENFISENVSAEKAEALLPTAVENVIKSGSGKVKFYTSQEKWFGMTYAEDRAIVKQEIAKKIAEKYYPEKLWEK